MTKTYTFAEYRQMQELNNLDRFIGHLKKHKTEYAKLVFLLAIYTPKSCFALTANEADMSNIANEIIQMGMLFAKYGCMIKGLMNMTNEMLEGANLKEAMGEGVGYFVFYLILNFYPKVFAILK